MTDDSDNNGISSAAREAGLKQLELNFEEKCLELWWIGSFPQNVALGPTVMSELTCHDSRTNKANEVKRYSTSVVTQLPLQPVQ